MLLLERINGFAAACTIWFDQVNGVGLFEPVATHPDFQGRGLGKAVMALRIATIDTPMLDKEIYIEEHIARKNIYA